MRFHFC